MAESRLCRSGKLRLRSGCADRRARKELRRGQQIDLRLGLGRDVESQNIGLTTPGVVYKDLLILGSITSEGLPAAPGHIRAFDLKTGKHRWIFIRYHILENSAMTHGRRTHGSTTWRRQLLVRDGDRRTTGTDIRRTGSAAFDFYGANRAGDNLFANCLLALNAATGSACGISRL